MTNDNIREFHSPQSFMAVVNGLPEADEKPLFTLGTDGEYRLSQSEGDTAYHARQVDTHKVVYNPDSGMTFGVVTDEYEIIQPSEFLGPMVEVCKDRERTDMQGFISLFDHGASAYGEVLFDTDALWPPDRSRSDEPVRTGVTFRYSHDGGVSVRASGFAQDGKCKNTMRQVTDSIYIKHAGDVRGRVDFHEEWNSVFDQLGVFSESLATVIEGAMEFALFDFESESFESDWIEATDPPDRLGEIPDVPGVSDRQQRGVFGYYDYLGFPNYLSLTATDRLVWRFRQQPDQSAVTAWDAYSAMTYALSHEARFDSGTSTDDQYHRTASDILTNPAKTINDAQRAIGDRLSVDEEQDVFGIEQTTGEALQQYEQREQQLRGALEQG
jgi:hypothetical protein